MTKFKKGDAVTLLSNWDDNGTVRVLDLIVHSCGKKQMILVDAAGTKFQGQFFKPDGAGFHHKVVTRLSSFDGDVAALKLGAEIVAFLHDHVDHRLAQWGHTSEGYRKAMEARRNAIHEPRVYRPAAN